MRSANITVSTSSTSNVTGEEQPLTNLGASGPPTSTTICSVLSNSAPIKLCRRRKGECSHRSRSDSAALSLTPAASPSCFFFPLPLGSAIFTDPGSRAPYEPGVLGAPYELGVPGAP